MNDLPRMLASGFMAFVFFSSTGITNAAEIKVLCANAVQASMEDLGPKFEKVSKHTLAITFYSGFSIEKKLRGGEIVDIVLIPNLNVDNLVKDGKAAVGNVTPIASAGIGVAVRKGAPKPDISSVDAFKRTLLAAKSVTYAVPESSVSGAHFSKVLERLGIATEINEKTVFTSGQVGPMLTGGKAELAVNQISTLLSMPGIDVVGPLPAELQNNTVYSAVILNGAKNSDAAKALVAFLRGAEAAKVLKAKGMAPG